MKEGRNEGHALNKGLKASVVEEKLAEGAFQYVHTAAWIVWKREKNGRKDGRTKERGRKGKGRKDE